MHTRVVFLMSMATVLALAVGCTPPGGAPPQGGKDQPPLDIEVNITDGRGDEPGNADDGEEVPDLERETLAEAREPKDCGAVLILPGWAARAAYYGNLESFLKEKGFDPVESLQFPRNGISADYPALTRVVADHVKTMIARGVKRLNIVGHSQGGFLGMEYARRHRDGEPDVPILVSLSAPHGLAQLRYRKFGLPERTRVYSINIEGDALVEPPAHVLQGGTNYLLPRPQGMVIPHLQMIPDKRVQELVANILIGKAPPPTGPQTW